MLTAEQLLHPRVIADLDYPEQAASGGRSPGWRKVRNDFVVANPACAACGHQRNLNVHHIHPFHLFPEIELEPANLITLGELCPTGNHHLLFGHLGSWYSYDLEVANYVAQLFARIKSRP